MFVPGSLARLRVFANKSAPFRAVASSSGSYVPEVPSLASDLYASNSDTLAHMSRLSLAPMMEYTDRHMRHMIRLLSSRTLLYTEMVAANALAHQYDALRGCPDGAFDDHMIRRFLSQQAGRDGHEYPGCVLQLGGSCPDALSAAARISTVDALRDPDASAPLYRYTALNLNCGCPSEKVAGKGAFGASLMSDADLVRSLCDAMAKGSEGTLPVTVKCRIGTDLQFDGDVRPSDEAMYSSLCRFVETVAAGGVVTDFQVHARLAVLGRSYSPAQNRNVPPLRHDIVRKVARRYPDLTFHLNGGVDALDRAAGVLEEGDLRGVMVGRSLAADPWGWAGADRVLYGEAGAPVASRRRLLELYGKHADREEELWDPAKIRRRILRPVQALFAGERHGKRFRIALDEIGGRPKQERAGKRPVDETPLSELLLHAADSTMDEEVLNMSPEESYEKKRQGAGEAASGVGSNRRTAAIAEWDRIRKSEPESATACAEGR